MDILGLFNGEEREEGIRPERVYLVQLSDSGRFAVIRRAEREVHQGNFDRRQWDRPRLESQEQ